MRDRRSFLSGLAGLSAVALIGRPAAARPLAFDPAAYVADLKAIGCRPYAFRRVLLGGALGPWRYGISAPADSGFGEEFDDVMRRWSAAPGAWRDKHERVAAYIAGGSP